ncbi:MAG: hypothetical protein JRJ02_05285 [Deltaproteobacteria bacterium]|nr:hypothetical protein [Deltaproteobacteria bacterium]
MEDKRAEELEEKLPYCTTTPSAEQARAHDEDEPCDDGRGGDTNENNLGEKG